MDCLQKKAHFRICSVGFFRLMIRFNHQLFIMTNPLVQTFAYCIFFSLLSLGCSEATREISEQDMEKEKKSGEVFKILILGDSLTEGYGVMEQEAFPYLLEIKLNQELAPKTGLFYQVINGGISGSTSSGGVSRIEWFIQAKPDFLILALGGNDGLRGISVDETKKNLSLILETAHERNISTLLAGMKIPPNYGFAYTESFSQMYFELAKNHDTSLLPFLLKGVGGNPKKNLPDRIHPNPAGHEIIAENVFQHLSKILSALP